MNYSLNNGLYLSLLFGQLLHGQKGSLMGSVPTSFAIAWTEKFTQVYAQ